MIVNCGMKKFWTGLLLLLSNAIVAQSDIAPKYVNEFLNIGAGARGYAMSGSVISSTHDAYSGYWNPAGLARLNQNTSIGLMHAEYFAGIAKLDFASYAKKIDDHQTFGASVLRFGVDNIPNTIDLYDPSGNVDYSRISYFSTADYAFIFSYAQNLLPQKIKSKFPNMKAQHQWGANAKVIYRHIGSFAQSWGFGFDFGYQGQYKNWSWAVVGKDITGTFNAWSYQLDAKTQSVFASTGNVLPENNWEIALPRINLGGARSFQWKKYTILLETNAMVTTDGKRNTWISGNQFSIDPGVGLEVVYQGWLKVRTGMGNIQKNQSFTGEYTTFQPNIGLGIQLKNIEIDYALTDIGNQSDVLYTNMFSLTYNGLLSKRQLQKGAQ
jgi:hypothetical protein